MEEMIFKEQSLGEANRQMISHHKEFRHPSCLCEMESHKTFMVLPKRLTRAPWGHCRSVSLDCGTHSSCDSWGPCPWMCICVCVSREEREGGVAYFCHSHRQNQEEIFTLG